MWSRSKTLLKLQKPSVKTPEALVTTNLEPLVEPAPVQPELQTEDPTGMDPSHDGSQRSAKSCKSRVVAGLVHLKNFVMVFVLKFLFGLMDVMTDLITGINYLTGQYGLSLYFIAGVRSDYAGDYGSHPIYASLTLSVVWLPGLFRTLELALKTNWREMSALDRTRKAAFLMVMTLAWPALNPIM